MKHYLASWTESSRGGGGQCSCGMSFKSSGYGTEGSLAVQMAAHVHAMSAADEVAQRSDAGASESVTERVRQALAAIYSGAGPVEAECLLDQLEDLGLTVVDR